MKDKAKYYKMRSRAAILVLLLLMANVVGIAGCGRKKADIPVFQYEKNEDGTVNITGLTDKGKTDAKVTIPSQLDGAKVIAVTGEAFRDCSNLKEVVFEEGIESISENTFFNCVNLETITFPQSLHTVGTNAVKNTLWEKNILESADEVIINDILVEVYTKQNKYTVADGIKTIASGAFYGDTRVQEIVLPDSVEQIGTYAFSGCTALTGVRLPEGLKNIGYGAFSGCTALELQLPAQIESIGQDAFLNVLRISYSGSLTGAPWGAASLE